MHESNWFERNFGSVLLGVMVASGVGTYYGTESVLWGGVGFFAPPVLAIALWLGNDVHTHWQHGSGVKSDGSIQWRGEK